MFSRERPLVIAFAVIRHTHVKVGGSLQLPRDLWNNPSAETVAIAFIFPRVSVWNEIRQSTESQTRESTTDARFEQVERRLAKASSTENEANYKMSEFTLYKVCFLSQLASKLGSPGFDVVTSGCPAGHGRIYGDKKSPPPSCVFCWYCMALTRFIKPQIRGS